ncbi:MAG: PAS domain S-box protein [Thermoleophilia bacterium]
MWGGTLQKLDGLRVRLIALLLLAVLPAAALAAYTARDARQEASAHAQEEATALAFTLSAYVEQHITQAHLVLSAVAASPVVLHGSSAEVSEYLAGVAQQHQVFSSLLVTDCVGRVRVSGESLTDHPDLSDRDFWKQVQSTHAFSVGSCSIGRVTGMSILPVAEPILDDNNEFLGIVGTGVELALLESFVEAVSLPEGASFSVVDRNGVLLSSHPDPEEWAGKALGDLELAGLMLSGSRGVSEVSGPDGVTRLYAYAPVEGSGGAAFVAAGIPRSTTYAFVSEVVFRFALGLGITVAFVILAAWLGADLLVIRPLGRLVTAAQGLAGGDLSVRIGAGGGSGEIGQLARAFDSMAEAVEERTAAAEESEARYRALVESSPNGIIVHQGGRIVFANPAAAGIAGAMAPADLVGRDVMEFVHPDSLELARRRIEEAYRTGEPSIMAEERIFRLDGSAVDVDVVAIPLIFEGKPAISTIIRTITERKLAEKALRESRERTLGAQRLEAVGQLAGGIAHDFNNLLTAIIGYAEIGQVRCTGDPALDEAFAEIRASADRAAALTRQLLAFSRQQPLQPQVVDLNVVTESISGLLRQLIREDVELTLRCRDGLWPAEVDPGQIEQIITNLAINARDAMPGGGKLTIETANVELGEDYASTHPGAEPGPYVMLAVSDTGTGIDPDTLGRIFEPFFTTKEHGKGTGLGLSTVYGIVKQSGGTIYVYSELGQGTTFKIYFPRVDRPIDWTPEPSPTERSRVERGNETVLVVEDEPAVRALTARILEGAGYTVLHAGDPADAVKLFDGYAGVVHLLLTDVVLPGMSGRVLSETIAAKQGVHPGVLFMSGYTQDAIVHDGRLDAGVHFLEKPFTRDALLRKVREVLDRPREGQLEMDV